MEIDPSYDGREHSYIKHELLRNYLEKLLFITARGGRKEITYVDCFAGPWGDVSEDLAGTSFARALIEIKEVRDAVAAPPHDIDHIVYRAIFVEKSKRRHKKLEEYLSERCPSVIRYCALQGEYSDLTDEILRQSGRGFAFFFIDPKGWLDVGIPKLAPLLRRPNSEYLITFMYDFLVRAMRREDLRDRISQLFGQVDDNWIDSLWAMSQPEREKQIVSRYRDQLKNAMGGEGAQRPRSFDAKILDKDKNRTKYHMVYLTRHPKGIVEFARKSEKVEILQRRVRSRTREKRTGQADMFGDDELAFQGLFSAEITDVKSFWLERLGSETMICNESLLADWLEETGWLESDFQSAFGQLLEQGKVENLDLKRKRRTNFVHFDKGERVRRIQ